MWREALRRDEPDIAALMDAEGPLDGKVGVFDLVGTDCYVLASRGPEYRSRFIRTVNE
jgi:hypothetical protein